MPFYLRAAVPLAAVALVGCATPVVDDVADAAGAMTDGVVLVERSVALDAAEGSAQTNVSAKFMRLGNPADPELAERVVGSKLDLPAVGVCERAAPDSVAGKTKALGSIGSIELLDVGDVTLRAGGAPMTLAARAFPDVGDLVSGMFYTSRDAASELPAGGTYTLEGTGSAFVDRFAIEAEAPAALDEVHLEDVALGDGPMVAASHSAGLRWRAPAAAAHTREDLVVVDVSAASGASIRCTYADTGAATLPGWIFASSELGALPASATVTVHRVRERSFAVSGLDTGVVRFDLSVIGRVVVAQTVGVPVPELRTLPAQP